MDCLPNSTIMALAPWVSFSGIAAVSVTLSTWFVSREAVKTGLEMPADTPISRLQTYNISLVLYMLVIFYAFCLFLTMLYNIAIQAGYLGVDALFRLACGDEAYFSEDITFQWTLLTVDRLAGPRQLSSFVSMRLWSAHAYVFALVFLMGMIHTILFADGVLEPDPQDPRRRIVSPSSASNLFRHTATTMFAVFCVAYGLVVSRDLILIM